MISWGALGPRARLDAPLELAELAQQAGEAGRGRGARPLALDLVGVGVGILGVLGFSAIAPIGSTTPILAVMLGLAVGMAPSLATVLSEPTRTARSAPLHPGISPSNFREV